MRSLLRKQPLSIWVAVNVAALAGFPACTSGDQPPDSPITESIEATADRIGAPGIEITRSRLAALDKRRSFRAPDGTIYILGPLKTMDGGRRLVLCDDSDPQLGTSLNEMEMNSIYSSQRLFIALRNKLICGDDGRCVGKMWRSLDDFETLREEETTVLVLEAGKVENGERTREPADGYANEFDEWVGLFFHRGIIETTDGSLLAAMYGNFEEDAMRPTNPRSILETQYKHRTFVVRSTDQGKTWRYLSSVAVPSADVPDDSEGYNEWSIIRLDDGRLFGVMRTGHYTSLVASWSSDEGKTWTEPVAPEGLDPGGCDPYLLKLRDGRVALAYGQIVPPTEPQELYWKEYDKRADHRRRCRLAINEDGNWQELGGDHRGGLNSSNEVKAMNGKPFGVQQGREYDPGRTADRRKEAELSSRWFAVMLWSLCFVSTGLPQGGRQDSIAEILGPIPFGYARSVRAPDGTIYLLGSLKSTDGGKRLIPVEESDPPLGTQLYGTRLTSLLWRKGLFLGLYWAVDCDQQGRCVGKMWRSTDGFKTVEKGETLVQVPEAGVVPPDEFSEVAGGGKSRHLFFHRGIREMADGSLLAPMIGFFEQDTAVPSDPRSQAETTRKMRAFLVRSTDQGKTWRYLATIAAPRPNDVDNTEGYNECAIQLLDDGRLLAMMRTGHYTPLVASWSSDGGRTWTAPTTPSGLENGVDPSLLKLADGRLALAFGQMMPRTGPEKANYREEDTRRRLRLAVSRDGAGEDWTVVTVAGFAARSAYPTILEVEPNVIVYQSDLDLWRIDLRSP